MGPPLEDNEEFETETSLDEPVLEDDPTLSVRAARNLVSDEEFAVEPNRKSNDISAEDQTSNADTDLNAEARVLELEDQTRSSHIRILAPGTIMAELQRIEDEVRQLLERMDPRRKRRFGGTRRWYELQEDVIEWRFGDRFDEPTLQRILQLIAQRNHLYGQISFLAGTRPTWNS